jgi:hypothetical protein
MLLFRSEEHLGRWCRLWNQPQGGLLSLEQTWELALAWYGEDRRSFDWRRKTKEGAQAILGEIGLKSPFWQL